MIIAHLADLHLGYRAYSRVTATGVNQREADVAAAFQRALDAVVSLHPDLVLVAGDVFHSVRPSNAAIAEAFRRFASLASSLPSVPVVIVAGDRDTPRSADTATILELFREIPGVEVVAHGAEHLHFSALDAEVLAVPHAALVGGKPPPLRPESTARTRVLVMHAALAGPRADRILEQGFADGGGVVEEGAFDTGHWDYVALGHYPLSARVEPNVWYAGSIERTSTDIWREAGVEKGFLSYDTLERTATFHALPTREVVDLPRVSARDRSPEQVDASIAESLQAAPGGLAGRIVRLVITEIARADLRKLHGGVMRDARATALHFLLEARPPARGAAELAALPVRGVTLDAQVEEYLARIWDPTMEGIDREKLIALGRRYLQEASSGAEP